MNATPLPTPPSFNAWTAGLILLALAGNIAAWLSLPLLPDEAYYWLWSQRLEWSYFDHPPLVAWMIRPFTELFGSTAWAVRLPAVVSWFAGAIGAYALSSRIYDSRRAGALAVLVWSSLPIVQAGFHIVTPDTPMIIFGWVAYYFAYRAVAEDKGSFWLVAGAAAGLAMLGKYPGVLIPAALFLALLVNSAGRRRLRGPWPWLGVLAAAAAFAPVVWWNYRHDWVSFAFQFGHGVRQSVEENPLEMFLMFFGGQLAVVMPWTWFAMAWASVRSRNYGMAEWPWAASWGYHLLLIGFWLPLLLFGLAGLTAKSHPNWPVLAYIPGTVLLAGALNHWIYPHWRNSSRKWLIAIIVFAALIPLAVLNLVRFPQWVQKAGLDIPAQRTQLSQGYGWDQVEQELRGLLENRPRDCVIIGDRLQTASMIAFRLNSPMRVTAASDTRTNQFHLWERETPIEPSRLCLLVAQYDEEGRAPAKVDLGPQGRWKRARLLEVHNPDLSVRWYGFFVPEKSATR